MASKKGARHLRYSDRMEIERCLRKKERVVAIARKLNVSRQTIYNEIKRGRYEHLTYELDTEIRYSCDLAQNKYDEAVKNRGTSLKIGNDIKLANYIENKILNEDYSPDAVIGEITAKGMWSEFSVRICSKTVYNYISKNVFLSLTNKDLPVKGKRKQKKNKIKRLKRLPAGDSIEKRPEHIKDREEFGHWEMDSVIGKQKESKNTILALTERKTRNELIFKLPDHTTQSVVKTLNKLERQWGKDAFRTIFKTITVDNGTEFAACKELEKSVFGGTKPRTKLFYCHPYSSYERGSNENQNRMIRRKVPKGCNFDRMSSTEIKNVELWLNNYPRRMLGYKCSAELFQEELKKIS